MNRKLLIATTNQGKVREYKSLLKDVPFDLVSLTDEGITTVVEETGTTFRENAGLKAETIADESRLLTFADDSGIEVDALNGEPGVMSARYAGDDATDAERVDYLLKKMKDVPEGKRTARFRCVIAVAEPGGETEYFTGECEGTVPFKPAGELGFGYDPICGPGFYGAGPLYGPDILVREYEIARVSFENGKVVSWERNLRR